MKRNIFGVCLLILILFTPLTATARDVIIRPVGALRELAGGVVSFKNAPDSKNLWNFLIVGVSTHVESMSESTILYVSKGALYMDHEVRKIVYLSDASGESESWTIEFIKRPKLGCVDKCNDNIESWEIVTEKIYVTGFKRDL